MHSATVTSNAYALAKSPPRHLNLFTRTIAYISICRSLHQKKCTHHLNNFDQFFKTFWSTFADDNGDTYVTKDMRTARLDCV